MLGLNKMATFNELGRQPGGGILMAYLLDANVFIAANNLHYDLDFCSATSPNVSSASTRWVTRSKQSETSCPERAAARGKGFLLLAVMT